MHAEDVNHMLSCQESGVQLTRLHQIREFRSWMLSVDTDPDIVDTIIATLKSSNSGSFRTHLPPSASSELDDAATSKDRIGGTEIFSCFVSIWWSKAQQAYWESLPSRRRRSLNQWRCVFLRQWFLFSKVMWSHRNDFLHLKSAQRTRLEKEQEVNTSVVQQFQLGTVGLALSDQFRISDTSVEKVLVMDIKRKAHWVDNVVCARTKRRRIESIKMT